MANHVPLEENWVGVRRAIEIGVVALYFAGRGAVKVEDPNI